MTGPTDVALLDRAKSLCNEACLMVALQHGRLRAVSSAGTLSYPFLWWMDLQFLIVALRRLRRSAELASRVPDIADAVKAAIGEFDKALPSLAKMRNVGEHIDDYAVDRPGRRHGDVNRRQLQSGTWNGTIFEWLGGSLDIDIALDSAGKLFGAVTEVAASRIATEH